MRERGAKNADHTIRRDRHLAPAGRGPPWVNRKRRCKITIEVVSVLASILRKEVQAHGENRKDFGEGCVQGVKALEQSQHSQEREIRSGVRSDAGSEQEEVTLRAELAAPFVTTAPRKWEA